MNHARRRLMGLNGVSVINWDKNKILAIPDFYSFIPYTLTKFTVETSAYCHKFFQLPIIAKVIIFTAKINKFTAPLICSVKKYVILINNFILHSELESSC